MCAKYLVVLSFFFIHNPELSGQSSVATSADSTRGKKEVRRVNNTTSVTKMVVPNLEPKPVVLTPVTSTMSKGDNPGIQLDIPEVTVDEIQRDLEKRIKNKTKSKFVKNGEETSIQETIIKEISEEPVNVYVKLSPLDSGVRVITFVEERGAFIGESSGKFSNVKSFVQNFGTETYRGKVAEQVKSQEKILDNLLNELDKLKKQNEKMHADIKDNEASIINAEVDIKANTRQQELKDEEILQQKNVVNATSDKDLKKTENKKLNDLERQKDKFRSEINSLNRRIVKSRANIEDLEDEIELNLQEQELLKDKITGQRSLVKGFEGKLAKVK
jgi:hypothetical protein